MLLKEFLSNNTEYTIFHENAFFRDKTLGYKYNIIIHFSTNIYSRTIKYNIFSYRNIQQITVSLNTIHRQKEFIFTFFYLFKKKVILSWKISIFTFRLTYKLQINLPKAFLKLRLRKSLFRKFMFVDVFVYRHKFSGYSKANKVKNKLKMQFRRMIFCSKLVYNLEFRNIYIVLILF